MHHHLFLWLPQVIDEHVMYVSNLTLLTSLQIGGLYIPKPGAAYISHTPVL